MELLFWGLTAALSALGLVELIRLGIFWLLKPVVPVKGSWVLIPSNGEECEQLMRGAMARIRWMDWGEWKLLCLNEKEDPQVEAVCKILERRYPQLRLCKQDDLVYHIVEESKTQ